MTIYVYAETRYDAERWARSQGYGPREFSVFGNFSQVNGQLFAADDRVVLLMDRLDPKLVAAVERGCMKAGHGPPERFWTAS